MKFPSLDKQLKATKKKQLQQQNGVDTTGIIAIDIVIKSIRLIFLLLFCAMAVLGIFSLLDASIREVLISQLETAVDNMLSR